MRVLVVFASGARSPPVSVPGEIAAEMTTFDLADRFWRQATYVYDDLDVEWARAIS